nr:PREDICTED: nuclear receptor subfamily 0 group B member 2-like [Latimeria chalumnae]|eukprot:XP_006014123.2 PREDICTED: nuclear receptor subfamily 0 group B member 2-like [Latimeria chalumnae]
MACEAHSKRVAKCPCESDEHNSILYSILNKNQQTESKWHPSSHRRCHVLKSGCPCEERRKVVLETPNITCKTASEVLLKTLSFIKNLPLFYQLPLEDQVLLVHKCWVPLFILGLAQDGVDFEVKEIAAPSLLKRILLNESLKENDTTETSTNGASLAEVQRVKLLLQKLWSIDICTKEYAYLKGIILFSPGKIKAYIVAR